MEGFGFHGLDSSAGVGMRRLNLKCPCRTGAQSGLDSPTSRGPPFRLQAKHFRVPPVFPQGKTSALAQHKKKPRRCGAFFLMLAERTGLEPATPGVTGRYSNQLNYRSVLLDRCLLIMMQSWWALRGSNSRPNPCKGSALPTELSARTLRLLHPTFVTTSEEARIIAQLSGSAQGLFSKTAHDFHEGMCQGKCVVAGRRMADIGLA